MPIRRHLSKCSYHRWKSAASTFWITISLTPSKVVFTASWGSLMAYSSFFSLGNRKYTVEDILGKKKCIFESLGLTADQPSEHYGGGEDLSFGALLQTFSLGQVSYAEC